MNRICVLSLLLALAAPAAARVGVISLESSSYEVIAGLQTPQIRWAKPLAGLPPGDRPGEHVVQTCRGAGELKRLW